MDDVRQVILSLLSEHWNSGSIQTPWHPGFQTYFPAHGQLRESVSIISVTLTSYPIRTHGLPGKVHSGKKAVLVAFWTMDDTQKQFAEDEITRIIMDQPVKPSTDIFKEPQIDFLQITNVTDNDDYNFAPVVFRRDVEILVHYQVNFR